MDMNVEAEIATLRQILELTKIDPIQMTKEE
jgi:hypothetical protein